MKSVSVVAETERPRNPAYTAFTHTVTNLQHVLALLTLSLRFNGHFPVNRFYWS